MGSGFLGEARRVKDDWKVCTNVRKETEKESRKDGQPRENLLQ
jgi:hypothetical protein